MRAVVQRVSRSTLSIDGEVYSKIDKGFLVLLGVTHSDTEEDAKVLAEKISKLRVFRDENDKMNLSVLDIDGEVQVVSQFTLYADCHKGNRPSFTNAALPERANALYEFFIEEIKKTGIKNVVTGKFGADMKIDFVNSGPVTIILDCVDGKIL
ncbi:MAG: D-tyrosyl-tRNA(Tyr) deacylase [Clostridia bacterium]|nr:D-tyrosyl-tRNA(Tyr) deacylase [Clostridia bacterium]